MAAYTLDSTHASATPASGEHTLPVTGGADCHQRACSANHIEATMEPSITDLLQTGLQLMIVGMGIVFLFLALLVGAVTALPRILRRVAGEKAYEQTAPTTPAATEPAIDSDVLSAIQTAIRLYENQT